jgi:hypothetical protein
MRCVCYERKEGALFFSERLVLVLEISEKQVRLIQNAFQVLLSSYGSTKCTELYLCHDYDTSTVCLDNLKCIFIEDIQ